MKLADALAGVQRLFIDTAPLIYFIEQHPVYLERMPAIMQQICDAFLTNNVGIKRVQEISIFVLDEIEVESPGAA